MRTRRDVAFLLLMGCALAGCGGSASIGLADLPARVADVDCVADVRCGTYPDEATCRSVLQVSLAQLQADVAAGKVKYDGVAAASCLDSAEASIGSCRLSQRLRGQNSSACDRTFLGTLAAGAACSSDEVCASANCDRSSCADSCCPGTCQAPVDTAPRPAGAACDTSADCADGTFCSFGQGPSVCTPLLALGQSCESSTQCKAGTGCLSTAQSDGKSVCAVPALEGEPCVDINGCDLPGDSCDLVAHACQARRQVGASCDQQSDDCVRWAFCGAEDTCVARGGVGAACDPTFSTSPCLPGLICAGGACAVPEPSPLCPQT